MQSNVHMKESGSVLGDLILTGATGFVGSHVLLEWLRRDPDARACCLVRGPYPEIRLRHALATCQVVAGIPGHVDELMRQVTVIEGDLCNGSLAGNSGFAAWTHDDRPTHVVHCAANLSFKEQNREAVFATNLGGTKALWGALADSAPVASMNHLSTAFVAGAREGVVREQLTAEPPEFNNPYEESKWAAEHLVWKLARAQSVATRVFRPSIVIGHSETFLSSTDNGLYKVTSMLQRCGETFSPTVPVRLRCDSNATLNLIPIDLVVGEMLDIIGQGKATLGRTYHLTNERPLTVGEILSRVVPETGLQVACSLRRRPRGDRLSAVLVRAVRHYEPYLTQNQSFDRTNVCLSGVANRQANYVLDLARLAAFVRAYLMLSQYAPHYPRSATRTVSRVSLRSDLAPAAALPRT